MQPARRKFLGSKRTLPRAAREQRTHCATPRQRERPRHIPFPRGPRGPSGGTRACVHGFLRSGKKQDAWIAPSRHRPQGKPASPAPGRQSEQLVREQRRTERELGQEGTGPLT